MHERRKGRFYVTLAAIAWSTAGLMQRELSVGVATQLSGRALFAVVGLLVYIVFAERGHVIRAFRAIGGAGLGIAGLMAVCRRSSRRRLGMSLASLWRSGRGLRWRSPSQA
jgi:hypothetical protein